MLTAPLLHTDDIHSDLKEVQDIADDLQQQLDSLLKSPVGGPVLPELRRHLSDPFFRRCHADGNTVTVPASTFHSKTLSTPATAGPMPSQPRLALADGTNTMSTALTTVKHNRMQVSSKNLAHTDMVPKRVQHRLCWTPDARSRRQHMSGVLPKYELTVTLDAENMDPAMLHDAVSPVKPNLQLVLPSPRVTMATPTTGSPLSTLVASPLASPPPTPLSASPLNQTLVPAPVVVLEDIDVNPSRSPTLSPSPSPSPSLSVSPLSSTDSCSSVSSLETDTSSVLDDQDPVLVASPVLTTKTAIDDSHAAPVEPTPTTTTTTTLTTTTTSIFDQLTTSFSGFHLRLGPVGMVVIFLMALVSVELGIRTIRKPAVLVHQESLQSTETVDAIVNPTAAPAPASSDADAIDAATAGLSPTQLYSLGMYASAARSKLAPRLVVNKPPTARGEHSVILETDLMTHFDWNRGRVCASIRGLDRNSYHSECVSEMVANRPGKLTASLRGLMPDRYKLDFVVIDSRGRTFKVSDSFVVQHHAALAHAGQLTVAFTRT